MRFIFLSFLIFYLPKAQSITSADLEYAPAQDLLNGMKVACEGRDRSAFFNLYSEKVRKNLSDLSSEKQSQTFGMYCGMVNTLIDDKLGGDPYSAGYHVINAASDKEKYKWYTLCIVPKGDPSDSCKYNFMITIENGRLKKNEL